MASSVRSRSTHRGSTKGVLRRLLDRRPEPPRRLARLRQRMLQAARATRKAADQMARRTHPRLPAARRARTLHALTTAAGAAVGAGLGALTGPAGAIAGAAAGAAASLTLRR